MKKLLCSLISLTVLVSCNSSSSWNIRTIDGQDKTVNCDNGTVITHSQWLEFFCDGNSYNVVYAEKVIK